MAIETKLPTDARSVIRDPDLAAVLEEVVEPLKGEALAAAQAAIREVRSSGLTGGFHELISAYREVIADAVERAR